MTEPVSGLVCPYASATESATTVPGSAHGISTNKLTRRFHLFDAPVAVTAVTQKLQITAPSAAMPAISRLFTQTARAAPSPAKRAKIVPEQLCGHTCAVHVPSRGKHTR